MSLIVFVIILLPVVIEGRKIGSEPSTSITTSNTFASAFGNCSPMLATLVTVPVYDFSGKASTTISTCCPALTLFTSISLTYVLDSIEDISGSVATTLSHGLIEEPTFLFDPILSRL